MGGWKRVAAERATEIERLRARVSELEDRLDAANLSEFHAARSVAYPARQPETRWEYSYDETGIVRERALPEPAE